MVFPFSSQDDPWRELDSLAARAGVSVEQLCSAVAAVREFTENSTNASKGSDTRFYSPYDDDLEQVLSVLRDDDFELAVKEASWDENKHPRDKDGRFANGSGSQTHAGISYGAVVRPKPYVPPSQLRTASEARDELIRQGQRLAAARRPLEIKLKRARNCLIQLNAQKPADDTQRASLNDKREKVSMQAESLRSQLELAERDHITQLRQLLYVADPTPVSVRFDARSGYERNRTPLAKRRPKRAAWTGAEEMKRLVSAKVTVGDMFFEQETNPKIRSNYKGNRRVRLTEDAGTRVVIHEFGHAIEELNPRIKQKAIAFRARRTQGEMDLPLSQFDPAYAPGERTRKDRFIDPYMGKIYPGNSHTEITTMGIEYFYSDPVRLATEDPDYFDFIYDTLRGN